MQNITSAQAMQRLVLAARQKGQRIGVVPTMGFLHDGHASLIREARAVSDVVVTTIFVNPLQFAPNEDFTRYPRDLERDTRLAESAGCDVLFTPTPEEIYPNGFQTTISIGGVTKPFEGIFRPTHFDGVATVVAKLFHLTQPDRAFFGQKDYQQCMVVKKMVSDLAMPLEIIICPTLRETDGLAMSSRNVYLSAEDRQKAPVLFQALQAAKALIHSGERRRMALEEALKTTILSQSGITIDYAVAADSETLAQPDDFSLEQAVVLLLAVRLGTTRLIDNLVV